MPWAGKAITVHLVNQVYSDWTRLLIFALHMMQTKTNTKDDSAADSTAAVLTHSSQPCPGGGLEGSNKSSFSTAGDMLRAGDAKVTHLCP